MKTRIYLFLAFTLLANVLFAQNHLFITGKIIDKKTGTPISYAHVGIPEKGIGTTTAHDGTFYFKVPKFYDKSTMIVSFIGYKTFRFPINQIKGEMTIRLEVADNELKEIVVMEPTQVEDIIRRAVKNIPKNYPTHPTQVLGFYRESRTDDSLKHIYMAEGVLKIYKKSYKKSKEGYVSLVQGRRINLKNPLDTIIRSGFTSGHMAAHRFDIVQNREDFLQEKYFPVYKYWIESMTTYNDKPVYVIAFDKDEDEDAKEIIKKKKGFLSGGKSDFENGDGFTFLNIGRKRIRIKGRMKGRIYIEKESYAIIKADFEIRKDGLNKTNDYPLYAGRWDANTYSVNYRKVGDKWYFSDAVREGAYGGGGTYSNEIKITEMNLEKAEPLPYLERMSRGMAFSRMTGTYDSDFWKDYNTTPFSLELAETVQQIENAQKAQEAFDLEYMELLQTQRDSIKEVERLTAIEEAKIKAANGEISFDEINEMELVNFVTRKKKKKYSRVKWLFGTGAHLLSTQQDNMSLTFLSDDETPETIVSLTDNIGNRNFEIVTNMDFDIFFHKNFFVRLGTAWDWGSSIYQDRSVGIGTEINLSRQRPFYLKAIAQYDNLKYARRLGAANNDYGKFKANGKKFKGNSVYMYYGSRTHNLKLSGEIAIELHPGSEFYVRGTYFMPFHRRQDIWLKERKQLFKRNKWIPVSDDRVEVLQNDTPFDGMLMPEQTLSISVGLLFK